MQHNDIEISNTTFWLDESFLELERERSIRRSAATAADVGDTGKPH